MSVIERLQTFYDARYTVPVLQYSLPTEAPPNIIFFKDYVVYDLYGDALDPVDVTYPPVISLGDFLLLVLGGREGGLGAIPAPWTTIFAATEGGNTFLKMAYLFATGTETGSFEIPQGAARWIIGGILRFEQIDPASPVADYQLDSAYTDNPISPAATVAKAESLVVRAFGKRIGDPGAYVEDTNYPAGDTGVFDQAVPTPSASGSVCAISFQRGIGAGPVGVADWGIRPLETNAHITATVVFNVKSG